MIAQIDSETARIVRELSEETGKPWHEVIAGAVRMLGMVYATRARPVVTVARVDPNERLDG